ncbi:hypothetical protein ABEB36_009738 [Hypothenemus hampei]|uniref:tRNA-intron lyase n=1 Tax=Hypothenemus hampei TaxID=57062 RepID=A0ABD1EHA7_HYPHA
MIKLKFVNGNVLVYDLENWMVLRKQYRIVGNLIGTTNTVPALPTKLLPEESLLLLENGLAELCKSDSHLVDKAANVDFEQSLLEAQQVEYRQARKAQLEIFIDEIVKKRRILGDTKSKEEILKEEIDKSSTVSKENMLWPIALTHPSDKLIPVPQEALLELTNPLKTAVYKDLWKKGYFITSGEKFGVKCCKSDTPFTPVELVAFGRLGVSVKKRAVLASMLNGEINYLTINWIDA